MKETRITVIFTGGTIGSAAKNGYLSPGGEKTQRLLLQRFAKTKQAFYEKRFQTSILFQTTSPYEILSENLNGGHLEALWRAVSRAAAQGCDGIVIATGTDSLAYSSAAMGYLFADTRIPIVMVSANYPLSDPRSNGPVNFENALLLILEGVHRGVFCSYHNGDGAYLHYATRLLVQPSCSDSVFSIADRYYARVEAGSCRRRREPVKNSASSDAAKGKRQEEKIKIEGKHLDRTFVFFVRPCPGMRFFLPDSCDAVLLDTYHSGTLPVLESGFAEFMKQAHARRIPVWIAGVPDGAAYETMASYRENGAPVLPEASPAAMYVKLWLLLANGLDAEKYMPSPIGHDIPLSDENREN